jgi:hypothetical protein
MELLDVLQGLKNRDNSQRNKQDGKSKDNLANQVQTQNASQVQPTFPIQRETIKSDFLIQGNKIFSDVTWKTKKAPGSQGRIFTGIGVYCQINQNNGNATVLI